MNHKTCGLIILLFAGVLMAGCSSDYYVVRDPVSKHVYYTKKVKQAGGGTASFTDDRSGAKVTLQNSEIKEISESEYEAGLKAPASTPEPSAAPAAAPAPAPAAAPALAPAAAQEAAPVPSSEAVPTPEAAPAVPTEPAQETSP